jgi:hypothetical protein
VSPVSAPEPAIMPKKADPRLSPAPRGAVSLNALMLAGAISAAVFGSHVVLREIQSEPDMAGYATLRHAAVIWDHAMQHARASVPDTALHAMVRKVEAARF